MASSDTYTIRIDGTWTLEDLHVFPHKFEQVYYFIHSLDMQLDEYDQERVDLAYKSMPWFGGYSAVNFYNQLKYITPKQRRPKIISISYSSPGWIELSILAAVALNVGQIAKRIAGAARAINRSHL